MIQETIGRIEDKIKKTKLMQGENKDELLHLVAELKSEVMALSKTHPEQAESIAGFADISAHEAVRDVRNPDLSKLSTEGLLASVREFEQSHPRLVSIVNVISNTLSNMGI
ncbi:MAG: DUF4404 family protein [Proteobacteria bacterium]|nr:DUF4404 family protein [Pseudomonadota bacterium]